MKIIEALKKVKANRAKISEFHKMIAANSAHLSNETSPYEDPAKKIEEWVQSARDLNKESVKLLTQIAATNLKTMVPIEIGGKSVTKSIASWVYRRREFAELDRLTFAAMTDRKLKEGSVTTSTGTVMDVKIVRNYDAEARDTLLSEFREEPHLIDSALEVVNATTDLIEV